MDAPPKAMTFSVLFKKEKVLWSPLPGTGHRGDRGDLQGSGEGHPRPIRAQVHYAFANDNLDYLYHPRPQASGRNFSTVAPHTPE
jgi:hypothetical protein